MTAGAETDVHGDPTWLTVGEAAELLGVNPKTVGRWADGGWLRSIRTLGGHRRVDRAEVVLVARARRLAAEARTAQAAS